MTSYEEAIAEGERVGLSHVLVPPRTLAAGAGGTRISRRAGGSLEFRDHRDYEPGDDLRHLDWNVFARSDRLTVKQFHEEISPFVEILVDGSRSMALAGTRKAEATLAIAAMIAAAAVNAAFPYALSLVRDRVQRVAGGSARPTSWNAIAFDHAGTPAVALASEARTLRPLSMRFFISDLLWPGEPQAIAAALAQNATATVIIQVLGADDANPELRGGWRVVDAETNEWREVFFDASAVAQYRDALARHRELWDESARYARAVVTRCIAEEVERNLVFDDLAAAEILRPAWSRS
ncbi:MAG TPA: DUF58 domain-containing protein [Thermoanaerobaculia bacterium]|nr:DUF58 domain-containing protein [Thermoanaerobaculia bacterium]